MWSSLAGLALLLSPLAVSSSSSFDCSSVSSDGFYSLGCSSSFVACAAGRSITMICPDDLKYDQERQKCEYPGNVPECGGEAPEEGSGDMDGSGVEGSGSDGSGEVEGSGSEGSGMEGSGSEGSGTDTEDVSGKCVDRADGFYRLSECSSHFLGCSGGVSYRMDCPASLKYDEHNQICDYPGNVEGCADADEDGSGTDGSGSEEGSGTTEGPATTEGSGTAEGSGSVTDGSGEKADSDVSVEKDETETEEVIVSEKRDKEGDVEVTEEVKEMETEDEIIDTPSSDSSDSSDSAAVAESSSEEVVAVDEDLQQVQQPAPEAESSQHKEKDPVSCSDRRDGFYALGCSSDMLACSNGISTLMNCPAGLVFDERNQMCDHPAHVSACGARDSLLEEDSLLTPVDEPAPHPEIPRSRDNERMAATTVAAPTTRSAAARSSYDRPAADEEERVSEIRENRMDAGCKSSDGLFSLGCSHEFVSCHRGVATAVECGEAEAFDEHAQSCVPLARHPLCFAHAVTAADVIDDDVEMVKETDDEQDLSQPIDHTFACEHEGAYADAACSDLFTLCENGRGLELYCLQGYLFDSEARKCVPAGELAHCAAQ